MIEPASYRTLGKTGLRVSPFAFGASFLGGVFGDVDEQAGIECVRRAVELGINFFDVSPFYGLTRAETILGKALEGLRDQIILCSKAGRIGDREFDFSAKHICKSVDESLQRLKTDHLDILLAHDIEYAEDESQIMNETAKALDDLKRQGKCRFVGMSGYPLDLLDRVVRHCSIDVVLTYCHYTLQNQRLIDELLPTCKKFGTGCINASPLVMGLLSKHGPAEWHPATDLIKDTCRRAVEFCSDKGKSLERLAIQFSLQNDNIATTLVGSRNLNELHSNIECLNSRIDDELLGKVKKILSPIHDLEWDPTA